MLTQAFVRERFDYDPETGYLTYRFTLACSPNARQDQLAGSIRANGYLSVEINQKRYLVHRVIWLWVHGYMPEMMDHVNRNKLDNSLANLRECTPKQNNANKDAYKTCISGLRGVQLHRRKWRARIRVDGEQFVLGYFDDVKDAMRAYNRAAKHYFGEFAFQHTL